MSFAIDFNLGKRLKEAGWPESKTGDGWRFDIANPEDEGVRVPTLEELINECGTGTVLTCWIDSFNASNPSKNLFENSGKTASEAVANLWLSLHK